MNLTAWKMHFRATYTINKEVKFLTVGPCRKNKQTNLR